MVDFPIDKEHARKIIQLAAEQNISVDELLQRYIDETEAQTIQPLLKVARSAEARNVRSNRRDISEHFGVIYNGSC